MKKFVLILSFALIVTIIPSGIFSLRIFANEEACTITQFTLSNINADQTTTQIGCYDAFDAANTAMKSNTTYKDMIITHDSSRSPSKIIAASRAIAMSFTPRWQESSSNASIATIWRNSNRSGDTSYISSYYDMAYYETVSYNTTDGSGTTKIQTSGFVGYIRLIQIDIIPMIYVENAWSIMVGGQTYNEYYNQATGQLQPYSVVPRLNYYNVYSNTSTNVREIRHYIYNFRTGNYSSYIYGLAPDWLSNGNYYSWDSIVFYRDRQMTQTVLNGSNAGKYFNYFQYLPLRSSTVYTAKQLDDYLELARGYKSKPVYNSSGTYISGSAMYGEGQAFIDSQSIYGVNALLTYVLAIHESGHGTSNFARTKNNLFGWGAHDANPGDAYLFESITQSVSEHTGRNLRGYLSTENFRYFGQVFGNKNNGFNTKYASDPYWGNKIAGHAYQIDRYHGFQDYGQYQLALVNKSTTISVKDSAATSAKELFATRSTLREQVMLVTDIKTEGNNTFVEVMSPMTVENKNVIRFSSTSTQVLPYSWNESVGYLVNEPIEYIYGGSLSSVLQPSETVAENVAFSGNNLVISGYSLNRGLLHYESTQLVHKLNAINISNQKTSYAITANQSTTLQANVSIAPYSITNMGYASNVNVSALATGIYKLTIESAVNISTSTKKYENTIKRDGVNISAIINNKNYNIRSNANNELILHVSPITQDTITNHRLLTFNQINAETSLALKASSLTLASSDNKVATVTSAGLVKAVGPGLATITIRSGNDIKAIVGVDVSVKAESFTVANKSVNFTEATQIEVIKTTMSPTNASNNQFTYVSQNTNIATVNQEGVILPARKGRTKVYVFNKIHPSLVQVINVSVSEPGSVTPPEVDPDPPVVPPVPPPVVPVVLLGDVNGDGVVDILDLVKLSRVLAGLEQVDEQGRLASDVNKDNQVDILDLVKLSRILAGLE